LKLLQRGEELALKRLSMIFANQSTGLARIAPLQPRKSSFSFSRSPSPEKAKAAPSEGRSEEQLNYLQRILRLSTL